MNILTISGSAQKESSNDQLLRGLSQIGSKHLFTHFHRLTDFPLFTAEADKNPPEIIISFKKCIQDADMVVISTPEYVHNIPAVLKNALEWVTSSGEFNNKKVLAITYTPNPPRGDKAMQSLLWSLQALNATIVAKLSFYKTQLSISQAGELLGDTPIEELKTIFEFIV
jgi:chromate reductase